MSSQIVPSQAAQRDPKRIIYDRETRDYAMYLDDQLIGFARTYHEAEITLDQYMYDQLAQWQPIEPAEAAE